MGGWPRRCNPHCLGLQYVFLKLVYMILLYVRSLFYIKYNIHVCTTIQKFGLNQPRLVTVWLGLNLSRPVIELIETGTVWSLTVPVWFCPKKEKNQTRPDFQTLRTGSEQSGLQFCRISNKIGPVQSWFSPKEGKKLDQTRL